jgi:hypothetical protein
MAVYLGIWYGFYKSIILCISKHGSLSRYKIKVAFKSNVFLLVFKQLIASLSLSLSLSLSGDWQLQ